MSYKRRTLRGQFTLRNLFVATFWSALWCWSLLVDFQWAGLDGLILLFRIVGPLIVIDALFGHDQNDCAHH